MDGWVEIYYERLAHVILEAKKSHNLSSANLRPRTANGIVLSPNPKA